MKVYEYYLFLQNQIKKLNKNTHKLKFNRMKNLKLDYNKALDAYKKASPENKKLLIDLYGAENFLTNVKDRVIDYPSACKELGLTPLTIGYFDFLPEWERERAFNRHQVTVGVRALVGDWRPNLNDSSYKYYTYGYTNSNGLGLCGNFGYDVSFTGADLLFPNADLRDHAQKIFEKQYLTFLF